MTKAGTEPSARPAVSATGGPGDAPGLAILETSLYAEDLGAAEEFYSGLLGLRVVARVEGRHLFLRAGTGMLLVFDPRVTARPASGALPVPAHGARGPGHICFALGTAELAAMAERLMTAGIALEADFQWPNGARSIYVRDPAGNSVEFAEPALWA